MRYDQATTTIAAAPSETTVRNSGSIVASSEPQRTSVSRTAKRPAQITASTAPSPR